MLQAFHGLAGKVYGISEADLALQRHNNRTNFLQFPAHAVSIHMVDSGDSLSFAAGELGLSLAAPDLYEAFCFDDADEELIVEKEEEEGEKKPSVEPVMSLRDVLQRSNCSSDGGASLTGFRQVVGLDSEWRVVMYAQGEAQKGASILQVRPLLVTTTHQTN